MFDIIVLGDDMKNLISFLIITAIIVLGFLYHEQIADFVIDKIIAPKETTEYQDNEYAKKSNYSYLQIDDDFFPRNKQDILNIIYTRLDQGVDQFYFYCEDEYESCIDDVKELTNDEATLSELNNFVHPYNSYNKLSITFDSFGKIQVDIDKLYTDEQITVINQKVDEIMNNYISSDMSDETKIQVIHDYIINTTKYDSEKANAIENNQTISGNYNSQTAYGPLIQGMGICGGYSDAIAIFLWKMDIPNYRIASSNHVWNLVNYNNDWYHLDLTWDDPVTSDGSDALIYDFFLITTNQLHNLDLTEHTYNLDIYKESL